MSVSWDSYIENLIAQSRDTSGNPHVDKVCIIGLDTGAKWTTDSHARAFKIHPREAQTIASVFMKKDFSPFIDIGVSLDETNYKFIKEEDQRIVYARYDRSGVTMQCTKTAVVIAHTPEGCQQGCTNIAVNRVASWLEELGY